MQHDLYLPEREDMVRTQIEKRGIHDERVLEAMRKIPRHIFVPDMQRRYAYVDAPLCIGMEQTISQPYIVAVMSELLALKGHEKVLEIGTGSGYQTAILGQLAQEVYSLERISQLAESAQKRLEELGVDNVRVICADGTLGWPENAPYDGIIVTAAAPRVPGKLLDQLAEGGRLIIPVGERWSQVLQVWQRKRGQCSSRDCMGVVFVPLIGQDGWED